jgi:filamentous hemagglutinin family protein
MAERDDICHKLLWIIVATVSSLAANCATAQIAPDRTLPNNSSVKINGSVFNITGGTQAGRNLFHSFQQFSVTTGGTASFNNGLDIQNIISRVTGGTVSNIDGVIKTNGTANLFFLNPNGIIFGKNASLNVGGSFVATTANAIQFGNLGTFSASVPNNPALLTVNPTALFYNQIVKNASIQNSSIAPAGLEPTGLSSSGLRVPDGKSLLLVGGDIQMDDGRLGAYGGHVELGGLASAGSVGLGVDGNNISLNFPTESTKASVSLINGANVNVSAAGGGSITVNANNLNITGRSSLTAGIAQGLGFVGAKAGDITLNATGDVKIDGNNTYIYNYVQRQGIGNGGNITLSSNSLSLTNGAQLSASTEGQGNAGNVIINATKSVTLDGLYTNSNGQFFPSGIFSNVADVYDSPEQRNAIKGHGGNIQITTSQLSLTNDAQLQTGTEAQGDSGSVIINATKSVSLDGSNNTTIFSSVGDVGDSLEQRNAIKGNGGNIQITTPQLSLTNGAGLVSSTFAQGNAGNVIINATKSVSLDGSNTNIFSAVGNVSATPEQRNAIKGNGGNIQITTSQLSLTNGAQLQASTLAQGDSGSVIINATKSVSFDGSNTGILSSIGDVGDSPEQRNAIKGNGGNIQITTSELSLTNGAGLQTSTFAQGNAGTIKVNATEDVINSNGGLFVDSQSTTGTAGDIIVNSPRVTLDNTGILNAQSTSGNGGNINLQSDLLLLRHGALISTNAGTASSGGNGGNITINTPNGFIVSVKNENSDITANAFSGQGGKVTINATNVFNIAPLSRQDLERLRPQDLDPSQLPTNDITAISQRNPNLNGAVQITTPNIDPARSLVTLPTVTENPPKLVSSNCAAFNETAGGNNFTITGRGGLPPNPYEPLTSDAIWSDTRLPSTTAHQHQPNKHAAKPQSKPIEIVPATGWVFNGKGEVTLISSVSNATSSTPTSCPAR